MKNPVEIKNLLINSILDEAETIKKLANFVDDSFAKAVEKIFYCKGRIIVTGIGKSAHIAGKIVATFNSTGTPAIFMHAADAIHGDLGIVQKDDIVLCLSRSGDSPEIKVLIPLIKNFGNEIIGMVSNAESFLALNSDYLIRATVDHEACPHNLAPTNSTTAQLVVGDAIAICLVHMRSFSSEDFARSHPGGALGKRLYLRVNDLYRKNAAPKVQITDDVRTVIMEITSKLLGATAVINDNQELEGVITDGDLRRMLQRNDSISGLTAKDIMNPSPKTTSEDTLAVDAFHLMKKHSITQLLVVSDKKYVGVVHIHDIIREGIV